MAIYQGRASAQNVWFSGNVTALYWGSEQVFPDGWFWQASGKRATLLLYRGRSSAIRVPERIGGYDVAALAPTACNYSALRSVTIPANVAVL